MIRTFVGIRVAPGDGLRDLLRVLERLGRAVRVTSPENLHVTLKFLGPTPSGHVPEIAARLGEAAELVRPHAIELVGLGAFPGAGRPSVVWAGIRPAEEIVRLAADLDQRLADLGFPPETRPFHPHLTLARVRGRLPQLGEVLRENAGRSFGAAMVESVELFQSEPGPGGSRYTSLAKVRPGAS